MLHYAELIDRFRIVPRLFLSACFFWTVWVSYTLLNWYQHLPKDERGIEASGFASVVFLTVFGFLKLVYETYARTGSDWNSVPTTTTTVAATTTTTAATP
jgi:hypothetical protein